MPKTKVSIVKGTVKPEQKDIDQQVAKAVDLAGGLTGLFSKGDTVIIKPNLVYPMTPESGGTTDPRICKALADMVKAMGGKPVIAESCLVSIDTEKCFETAGYNKLRQAGYEVIDLKRKGIERVEIPIPKGKAMKHVMLPKIVVDAKLIISVAKMKTHDSAKVTLALKNMKGILPDKVKRSLHHTYGIFQGVADVCSVMKPGFSVIDGIIGMEGLGPTDGPAVPMGLIIAGKDPVAVDTVTCQIMGFPKETEGCIASCAKAGVGTDDMAKIEVAGEPIDKVKRRFQTVEEALAAMAFPKDFRLLMDQKACSGCRNMVTEVLMGVKAANQLERTSGWTVIAGKMDRLPDVVKAKLLLIGACTAKHQKEGVFVPGCPPNSGDIIKGMKGMGIDVKPFIDVDALDSMPD
jgi:uncharacterized protein (DUF362 family)